MIERKKRNSLDELAFLSYWKKKIDQQTRLREEIAYVKKFSPVGTNLYAK